MRLSRRLLYIWRLNLWLESYKNPVYTYETNVMGTVNILECVRLTPSVKSFP